jgi:serine/threonine protein kinase
MRSLFHLVYLDSNIPYVAPEHLSNTGAEPVRADIYTWGSCIYHLLLGDSDPGPVALEATFDSSRQGQGKLLERIHKQSTQPKVPLSQLPGSRIPNAISQIVAKAMSIEPDHRYMNTETLLADLVDLQDLLLDSAIETPDLNRFVLGRIDSLARYVPSPDLVAMEKQSSALIEAHARVQRTGLSEAICCYGESGTGKSKLLENLVHATSLEPGERLVGWAKVGCHTRARPLICLAEPSQLLNSRWTSYE